MNAIVVTFVFSVYLTGTVGQGLSGGRHRPAKLGRALAIAGVTVAVLARHRCPGAGAASAAGRIDRADRPCRPVHRRDQPDPDRPRLPGGGLALLAFTAACSDLASVPYNAMLRQLSTLETSGRISGLGWAAGYVGSVVLLMLVYIGFIGGSGPTAACSASRWRMVTNVRAAMLLTAAWFAVFALPLLLTAHTFAPAAEPDGPPVTLLGGYRRLWTELRTEWRRDRNLVYYLLVSAVFRDGLAGVFAFGAVLGSASTASRSPMC